MEPTSSPVLLLAPGSPLAEFARLLESDAELTPLELPFHGPLTRPSVLILAPTEAVQVWQQIEQAALDAPLFPVIVGDPEVLAAGAPAAIRLAPAVKTVDDVPALARSITGTASSLHRQLSEIDAEAEQLVQNSLCEWVKCSVGTIGVVRIREDAAERALKRQLELLRDEAYGGIDRLSADRLSTSELWTLLLIVDLPFTKKELLENSDDWATLRAFQADTSGSRKIVKFPNQTILSLVGPVEHRAAVWRPSSNDPLREELNRSVTDSAELAALQVLFKRRLSQEDIDRLIAVLARHS